MGWIVLGNGIPFRRGGGKQGQTYWTNRKTIPITGASGAGTNYQVLIEVNEGVGVDSDGVIYLNDLAKDFPNDTLFTDSDGVTKIPFWIDTVLGTATQKYIWVRPIADLSSGTQYIYVYYGKPAGTLNVGLSSGTDTFNLYEDFEGSRKISLTEDANTFEELIDLFAPNRYSANPVIEHGGGGWKDALMGFPTVIDDPLDSSKLIMIVVGQDVLGAGSGYTLGAYRADKSDPLTWTEYESNPVIEMGASGQFDNAGVLGPYAIVWNDSDSLYYLYYTGMTTWDIGLATSPDGITWTKYGSNPILTGEGEGRNDGDGVFGCAVHREDATHWYMYYTYRSGATFAPGIRIASSSDGISWAKQGAGDILSKGAAGSYDATYLEGCQIFKMGTIYVLFYNCYDAVSDIWSYAVATSSAWDSGWTKYSGNPIWYPYGVNGDWDRSVCSTIVLSKINNKWYGFYQGAAGDVANYNNENYDIGALVFDADHIRTRLTENTGWSGSMLFGVNRQDAKSNLVSCHIARPKTTAVNVSRDLTISNTQGKISFYFKSSLNTLLGPYQPDDILLYEGANIITGISIRSSSTAGKYNLQHLRAAAWENVRLLDASVWYKITIAITSKTTHDIYIDDVKITGLTTSNWGNITTNINKIRLNRDQVYNSTSYYDRIILSEYVVTEPTVGTSGASESGRYEIS